MLRVLQGNEISFCDVRSEPLSEEELAVLIAEFEDLLVDLKSNDWQALSDLLKYSEVEDLLAIKPKLMARPVIQHGDAYYLGWGDAVQEALLSR